jgi:ribose transport system ATP-binding protein
MDGRPLPPGRPDAAVRAGVGFLPGDRKRAGILTLTARENLTLADLDPVGNRLRLSAKRDRDAALHWFRRLGVRPADATEARLGEFSGGNQQKILFARWLRLRLRVLLLDDPTQGVDVGAKAELHRQIADIAAAGTAVVLSSTDVDELATLCSRVIILRAGKRVRELSGSAMTTEVINKEMLTSEKP